MIIIASNVVFMKALLLLVEERRCTHSLAISLIQAVTDDAEGAAPRSRDPCSADLPDERLSHPSSCMLAIPCCIAHLYPNVALRELYRRRVGPASDAWLRSATRSACTVVHWFGERLTVWSECFRDPAPETTVTGNVKMIVNPITTPA
jgi:hypothetical protein